MKKFLLLLAFIPVWCFAQTPVTPQFQRKIPSDSILRAKTPQGTLLLPDTSWVKKYSGKDLIAKATDFEGAGTTASKFGLRDTVLKSNWVLYSSSTSLPGVTFMSANTGASTYVWQIKNIGDGTVKVGASNSTLFANEFHYYKGQQYSAINMSDSGAMVFRNSPNGYLMGWRSAGKEWARLDSNGFVYRGDTAFMTHHGDALITRKWFDAHNTGGSGNNIYNHTDTLTGDRQVGFVTHKLELGDISGQNAYVKIDPINKQIDLNVGGKGLFIHDAFNGEKITDPIDHFGLWHADDIDRSTWVDSSYVDKRYVDSLFATASDFYNADGAITTGGGFRNVYLSDNIIEFHGSGVDAGRSIMMWPSGNLGIVATGQTDNGYSLYITNSGSAGFINAGNLRIDASGNVGITGLSNGYAKITTGLFSTSATIPYSDITGGPSGTVASVGLSLPSFITVTGSPVTGSGTLTGTLATQSANTIFAGPSSGGAAAPTFRSLVAADIPTLNQNTTGTATNITATSNSTLTTLSSLSLPYSQITGGPSTPSLQSVAAVGNSYTGQIQAQNYLATGTANAGYYEMGTQSASPASVTNHIRLYADSLNRLSWKNSLYRRTIQVPYPSDYTIRMPYLVTGTTLEDSTHAASTYVPQTRTVSTSTGLTGGGALSGNLTLKADTSVVRTVANSYSLSGLQTKFNGYVPTSTTVAGFALSSNVTLAALSAGTGLTFSNYTGAGAITAKADTTVLQTVLNFFPKGDTRYLKSTTISGLANPTGTIGLTAVNGSATTGMRSDGAPSLSQAIVPTWTGLHTFSVTDTRSSGVGNALVITPTIVGSGTAGFTGIFYNQTETSKGGGSYKLIDLQQNGSSQFSVDRVGALSAGASVTTGYVYASASTTSGGLALNGGNYGRIANASTHVWTGGASTAPNTLTIPIWSWEDVSNTFMVGTQTTDGTNKLIVNGTIKSGIAGTTLGTYNLAGNTSGTISIKPQAAAGTYEFNMPITAGSAGQVLTSQGGSGTAMTWSTAPIIQASADLTAQTSAGNVTTFTVGASTATFNISTYINVTAVSVDVIQGQITYTDENNTAQTISLSNLSAVGNSTYSPITIRAKNGTVITVKTNLTTGAGSITFDAGARITQM